MPVFRLVTRIEAPAHVCFDLSRSIDLHLVSMAASDERAITGITSGPIGPGEEVTWEARHFGRLWRMTSRITEYDCPRRFVDEMVRGPFAAFRHEHRFEPDATGTLMTDVVDFRMRQGPLVDLPTGRYLRRLLTARNEVIRRSAESS